MIVPLTGTGTKSIQSALISVYRAVFTQPPYGEDEADVQNFAARFPDHAQQPGFRCCVARQGQRITGFAYGLTGGPRDRWWESVEDCVRDCLGDESADKWLSDCFAVIELAVLPKMRRCGLGGQLHDALLRSLPYRTAMLSTLSAETPAMRLYRRRGWVMLFDGFVFPGETHPYAVMGLYLGKFIATQT